MKISIEAYIFVAAMIGLPLVVSSLLVNDQIIRHVCTKEGKRYSLFWLFDMYWHWRIFKLGWFAQARDAGFLPVYAMLNAAWICFLAVTLYLWPGHSAT